MTKNTSIPKLRFKEYSEPWTSKSLGDITNCVDYRGRAPIKTESGIFLVTAKNIKKGYIDYECSKEYVSVDNYSSVMSKGLPKLGDILFTTEAPMGNIAMVDNERIALAQRVIKFRGNESIKNSYLLYYMLSNVFQKSITLKSFGTTVQGISSKELQKEIISFPNHHEQTKIASFLTAVDDKLQALKKKKELLEQYKKGMMQQLFSQAIRFKKDDGTNYPDWEWKKLSEVSIEHLTKNTRNDVTEVFSVSKHKGVINQIEHLGRSFSSKEISNYKVIFHGDLVYTKSPTSEFPFGIIKQNRTERVGVVSPLYCVFKPVTIELGYILHEYFYSHVNTFNYLNPLVQKGAKNTMNINNETFLNGAELFLPIDNDEQTKIANFLSAIDDKIAHCQSELDGLEQWKKGLLQQLFC